MVDKIKEIASLLLKSKNTVVLTGAGMSTESGIPDFRSGRGVYADIPEEVFSLSFFYQNPRKYYDCVLKYLYFEDVRPNIGHIILAEWEKKGLVHHVITQNVDSLHLDAGSKNVIEIHGTGKTATCIRCKKQYVFAELVKKGGEFYYCDCLDKHANNLIKRDTVLFGESVPKYDEAFAIIQKAELILVLGTSLTVYPVAGLLQYAPPYSKVVIINKTPTSFDNSHQVIAIHDSIGETLKTINESIITTSS
ncbi:MAG: NAD-dependent deacylase [Desulfosporosinus sp.]|jgi:NAD-dependent deacetylase